MMVDDIDEDNAYWAKKQLHRAAEELNPRAVCRKCSRPVWHHWRDAGDAHRKIMYPHTPESDEVDLTYNELLAAEVARRMLDGPVDFDDYMDVVNASGRGMRGKS